MRLISFFFFFTFCITLNAQDISSLNISINQHIDGTLLLPSETENKSLAIIIAGSGPTDRNGNQNFMQNNSLKKLAEGLTQNGIATFRYDKRIVKQIRKGNVDEHIMFDDFIVDAVAVLNYFKEAGKHDKIYIIGHSQGSLVGMIAAKVGADGFVSLAGAGKPIDEVIIDQVQNTAPMFTEDTKRIFNILKEGKTTDDFPPALASIFNKEIQPFMSSWMQFNPQEVIKSLTIPVLILNGTKDLQVSEDEAKLLKASKGDAELKIITNMNHILVPIEGDNLENSKSYNEPKRALSRELIEAISTFIK